MMSKYVKYCMLLYDCLVYTVRSARILVWPLIYVYKHSYAYTKDQKYRVCNWNELRREITSLIVSFWYSIEFKNNNP